MVGTLFILLNDVILVSGLSVWISILNVKKGCLKQNTVQKEIKVP